jgi:hypothetical protein
MSLFSFGSSKSEERRLRRREQSLRRAELRRRKADERKARRQIAMQRKKRRKEEMRWRKVERKRRIANDKRIRRDRKRMLKQQKRNALGGGFGFGGRARGNSATARRAAHNLLSLANQIGVRFNAEDKQELLEYAEAHLDG